MKPEERVRATEEGDWRFEVFHSGGWHHVGWCHEDEMSMRESDIKRALTEAVTAERDRVLLEVSKVRQMVHGQNNTPQVVDAYCAACDLIRDLVRLTT